jgi:hypothetical protein
MATPHKQGELDSDNEPLSRTSSQSAASTTKASSPLANTFHPTKSLFVHVRGIPILRIPGPSHDTSIKITSTTSKIPIYTSERPSRWSATTSLLASSGETLGKITGDRFSNMFLRVIELHLLGKDRETEVVKIKRKGIMTRACVFTYHEWEYEWRYGHTNEGAKMNSHTLLVLERSKDGGGEKEVAARLVRDHAADEEGGTKATDAGRGGRLELGIVEKEGRIVEVLVVMSCLVMLKKEIDRRRNAHPIPITPAFSGSS